ncbi:hypothetical protein V8E53_011717 [Lactarius tabidus]
MPHFQQGIEVYNMDNIIWGLDKGEMRLEQLEAAPLYSAALCELSDTIEKLIGEHPEQRLARVYKPLGVLLKGCEGRGEGVDSSTLHIPLPPEEGTHTPEG